MRAAESDRSIKNRNLVYTATEEILEIRKDDLMQRAGENLIEYRTRVARSEKEIAKFHSYLLDQGAGTEKKCNTTYKKIIENREMTGEIEKRLKCSWYASKWSVAFTIFGALKA